MVAKAGGIVLDWEFGLSRWKLVHLQWIDKDPLYSTGNYIQYPMINQNEKECI